MSMTGTSHPFDEKAAGYLRCEGHGALVLRRLSDAEAAGQRIAAVILNSVAGQAGAADGKSSPLMTASDVRSYRG